MRARLAPRDSPASLPLRFFPARRSACSAAVSWAACSRWPRAGSAIASTRWRRSTTRRPGQIADVEIEASYDDLDSDPRVRQRRRRRHVRVRERAGPAAAAAAEEHAIVRPSGRALEIAQHRIREKTFLAGRGLPVTPFAAVGQRGRSASPALQPIGWPAVLKTAALGYDGKGQVRDSRRTPIRCDAWDALGRQEAVLEAFIDLEREISVIGARGVDGSFSHFDADSRTCTGITFSTCRSRRPTCRPRSRAQAVEVTRAVLEALEYVGILCIEFFVARDGRLLINELAPRPHNSGHLTFDACRTSQFEQQVRAICGLPLGSPELLQPAAMANLLGDLWANGEPDWAAALAHPDVKLHLYGKSAPARAGRWAI